MDRSNLFSVQTPQTFRTELIRAPTSKPAPTASTRPTTPRWSKGWQEKVTIVPGSYDNIKITTPSDVALATMKLGGCETRTGFGFDVHALVEGRKLMLGGVEIEFEKGLLGHSDADVMLHAIADACLGAAALGDIGRHFPDTDPQYKGISSAQLLHHVAHLVGENGWRVVNVDATLVCERPKIAPFIPRMTHIIAECLGIEPDRVSIKGTTTEGLGYAGRGEGIGCYAVANVVRG